jgi:hypothetical protein
MNRIKTRKPLSRISPKINWRENLIQAGMGHGKARYNKKCIYEDLPIII